ncbi:MAG: hypothetical protein GEU83_08645 [Pseudonocardiaceae bacterium]|nr:hypothetical protein [Pseudonocardiaceae bacterium]
MSAPSQRCAELADSEDEPRHGTAPPAIRWVLVEHSGPWGRRALSGSGLDPQVAVALGSWADSSAGRVTLIRRPASSHHSGHRRRWYLADSRPGHETLRGGCFADERELLDVLDGAAPGEPVDDPLYLVCAHGRHDACCAVRGRPVAAALATEYPGRTWECSHIGGDRFAANLVVLPHGFYYGHVPASEAVALARAYDDGFVEPRWLRGRSSIPPAVQAAQHHARLATGERGVDAFVPRGVESAGSQQWQVRLGGPDVVVQLRERVREVGRPLTCAAVAPGRIRSFELVEPVM